MAIATGTAILGAAALATAGSAYANYRRRKEAEKSRTFTERMSSTAHQRQMADLKAANLNPLLTGKYGGSSTPSGAVAQQENIGAQAPQAASAFETVQLQKQQQESLLPEQKKLLNAQTVDTINSAQGKYLENTGRKKIVSEGAKATLKGLKSAPSSAFDMFDTLNKVKGFKETQHKIQLKAHLKTRKLLGIKVKNKQITKKQYLEEIKKVNKKIKALQFRR